MTDRPILDFLAEELSTTSSEPLYRQLENALKQAVTAAYIKRGGVIPSERVLSLELNLSRVTVRKAIDGLVSDGFLDRRHGAKNGGFFPAGKVSGHHDQLFRGHAFARAGTRLHLDFARHIKTFSSRNDGAGHFRQRKGRAAAPPAYR